SQSCAQTLASLPQELERVGEGGLRSRALRSSPVLFDEVCLQGCGDFVGRLERLIDGPLPGGVVQHMVRIPPPDAASQPLHLGGRDACPSGAPVPILRGGANRRTRVVPAAARAARTPGLDGSTR